MSEQFPEVLNVLDGASEGYLKRVSLTAEREIQIGDLLVFKRDDGRDPADSLVDRFRPAHPISEERTFAFVENVFHKSGSNLKRVEPDAQLEPGDLLFFQQGAEAYAQYSGVRAIFRPTEANR